MSIYAPTTDYIWELFRSYGQDADALFRQAGIDPAVRFRSDQRVSRESFQALNRLLFEVTGDDAVGVSNAPSAHPSHYGALGYAWLASLSLRNALEKFGRYSRLVATGFSLEVTEHGQEADVHFSWSDDIQVMPFQRYAAMANLVQLMRKLLGEDFTPLRIEFEAGKPKNLQAFEEFFRCPMLFSTERAEIFVEQSILDAPLPRGHAELSQAADVMVQRYLADMDQEDIISRVRVQLIEMMPRGSVDIQEVSNALNMTSRTLHRRLAEHETTFRELLSNLRREMAVRYIEDASLTLTEISFLLGFSEPSSFTRAYKNWTGQAPSQARAGTEQTD